MVRTEPADPNGQRDPHANTLTWRRITLDRQLPHVRFLGSVAARVVIPVVGLILLAALTAIILRPTSKPVIPEAITASQKQLVTQLVGELRSEVADAGRTLETTATEYADAQKHDPAQALAS